MLITNLSSQLALVTGATGGIGFTTCHALTSLGCFIAVHNNSALDTAEELVVQLGARGVHVEAFQADLSSYEATRILLYRDVVEAMGEPTIIFNNAGMDAGKSGVKEIGDVRIAEFETCWRTNCGNTFLLTQLCTSGMERRGWGRVIFCGSVAGFTRGLVGPHYA
jgi:3-oxoacyl-[acyl-carrier protein] reductase